MTPCYATRIAISQSQHLYVNISANSKNNLGYRNLSPRGPKASWFTKITRPTILWDWPTSIKNFQSKFGRRRPPPKKKNWKISASKQGSIIIYINRTHTCRKSLSPDNLANTGLQLINRYRTGVQKNYDISVPYTTRTRFMSPRLKVNVGTVYLVPVTK
jgi:hypothetical protein